MSKTTDKMVLRRVDVALINLNRAGARLMDIKEGDRCILSGATICELLKFAGNAASDLQSVLMRIDRERHEKRKGGA